MFAEADIIPNIERVRSPRILLIATRHYTNNLGKTQLKHISISVVDSIIDLQIKIKQKSTEILHCALFKTFNGRIETNDIKLTSNMAIFTKNRTSSETFLTVDLEEYLMAPVGPTLTAVHFTSAFHHIEEKIKLSEINLQQAKTSSFQQAGRLAKLQINMALYRYEEPGSSTIASNLKTDHGKQRKLK